MECFPLTANVPSNDLVRSANIVFVSFNYRLNVFGFLALDILSSTDPQGSSGNYGLTDQITALRWVQRHISSFGGDPSKARCFFCSLLNNELHSFWFLLLLDFNWNCNLRLVFCHSLLNCTHFTYLFYVVLLCSVYQNQMSEICHYVSGWCELIITMVLWSSAVFFHSTYHGAKSVVPCNSSCKYNWWWWVMFY